MGNTHIHTHLHHTHLGHKHTHTWTTHTHTLGPAYNEQKDAKETARYKLGARCNRTF